MTRMKLGLVVVLLTFGLSAINAKKIYYDQYIMYDGKVDKNMMPAGKGKLLLHYETNSLPGKKRSTFVKLTNLDTSFGGLKKLYQPVDILEGNFEGMKISNAHISFCINKNDEDDCLYTYTGDVEYEITNEEYKSLCFKLTKGIIKEKDGSMYECTPEAPFTIIRSLGPQETAYTKSEGYAYRITTNANEMEWNCPISMGTIGTFQRARRAYTAKGNGQSIYFNMYEANLEEIYFDNSIKVINWEKIEFNNGDFFALSNEGPTSLKKQYPDGTLTLFERGTVQLDMNRIAFYNPNMSIEEFYKTIMKSNTFQETGLQLKPESFSNTYKSAVKGNAKAQYDLAMDYYEGKNVEKDMDAAFSWVTKAEINGYSAAAKMRKEMKMESLKEHALNSRNQYDSWIIGHMYEFGEGNDNNRIDICLDSALIWYKRAAALDASNQKYVTALEYKMNNNGADYWTYQKQKEEKEAYDTLCKRFGKKYVDDASHGRITIGMPEALLFGFFKTKLVQETTSSKLYRIYGWGATDFGTTVSISNTALLKSVWVSNGKVSSVRNWQ